MLCERCVWRNARCRGRRALRRARSVTSWPRACARRRCSISSDAYGGAHFTINVRDEYVERDGEGASAGGEWRDLSWRLRCQCFLQCFLGKEPSFTLCTPAVS